MIEEKRPKLGIGVYIINSQKQLLLQHRISPHAYGTWAPPGGHLEYGESFLDCAKREVKEETSLDIHDVKFFGISNNIYTKEGKHYVTPALLVTNYSGEATIQEPEKCDDMRWFDLNNLPSPLMSAVEDFFNSNPNCLCESGKKYNQCHGK